MTMAIHFNLLGPFTLSPPGTVLGCAFIMGLLKADHQGASLLRLVIAILVSVLLHLSLLNWSSTEYPIIDSAANIETLAISLHAINPSVVEKSSLYDPRPVPASKTPRTVSADLPISKRVPKSLRQRHPLPLANRITKKSKRVQSAKETKQAIPVTVDQSERTELAIAEPVYSPPEQRSVSDLESSQNQTRLPEDQSPGSLEITREKTSPPKIATASSRLKQPETSLIRNPRFRRPPRPPVYPRRAIRHGQEGTATLHVKIASEGTVQQINLFRSSGFTLLDQAATTAVRKWAFEPAMHNGFPMDAWVEVPVNFVLKQSSRSRQ